MVPQNGVNTGNVYAGWTVGNSLEFMPWDNNLSAEVKRSHDYDCVVTNKLGDKDTRKLSMKTTKLIARDIKGLLENEREEGFPTSKNYSRL